MEPQRQPWVKAAVKSVEVTKFAQTKNSVARSLKCQDNVDLFFDVDGIVQTEFVPPGQTVNQQFYLNVFKQLRWACDCFRPSILPFLLQFFVKLKRSLWQSWQNYIIKHQNKDTWTKHVV